MDTRLLYFAGHVGTGKSAIASCVAKELSWKKASFGDFVRQKTGQRGLDPADRQTLLAVGRDLTTSDPVQFCSEFAQFAGLQEQVAVVIEGLRHASLIPIFDRLGYSGWRRIVYFHSPTKVREKRLLARGEFLPVSVIDRHPLEAEDLDLQQTADLHVTNDDNSSVEDICARVVAWVREELSNCAVSRD